MYNELDNILYDNIYNKDHSKLDSGSYTKNIYSSKGPAVHVCISELSILYSTSSAYKL